MIRVITVATLLYLPTNFVATLFGMQFFYLTDEHHIAVAPQLWIVFGIAVPLTVITMGFWLRKRWETPREKTEKSIGPICC
jgi:Mg2+ and Co2+ transporter CorA